MLGFVGAALGAKYLYDRSKKKDKGYTPEQYNPEDISVQQVARPKMDAAQRYNAAQAQRTVVGGYQPMRNVRAQAATLGPAAQANAAQAGASDVRQDFLRQAGAIRAPGRTIADVNFGQDVQAIQSNAASQAASAQGLNPMQRAMLAQQASAQGIQQAAGQRGSAEMEEIFRRQALANEMLGQTMAGDVALNQQNAALQQQAALANQTAINQAMQQGAGFQQQTALANQQAALGVQQGNLQAMMSRNEQQAALDAALRQSQAQRTDAASLFGAQSANQQAQFLAELQNKTDVYNASQGLEAQRFNATMGMQAAQDYQSNLQARYGLQQQATANRNQLIGSVLQAGGSAAAAYFSDRRLKKKIKPGDKKIREFLDALSPQQYEYKDKRHGEGTRLGIMAQDMERSEVGRKQVREVAEGKQVVPDIGTIFASLASINSRLKEIGA